jgi:hypothetical protein
LAKDHEHRLHPDGTVGDVRRRKADRHQQVGAFLPAWGRWRGRTPGRAWENRARIRPHCAPSSCRFPRPLPAGRRGSPAGRRRGRRNPPPCVSTHNPPGSRCLPRPCGGLRGRRVDAASARSVGTRPGPGRSAAPATEARVGTWGSLARKYSRPC